MSKFESDFELMPHSSNDVFSLDGLFIDNNSNDEQDDIIVLHMDIREPLSKLKTLLEHKTKVDLRKYKFWLQDSQMLEPYKNLVDQCVEGEGIVQINVQIKNPTRRINIVDVLKPTEEALEMLANEPLFQEFSSYSISKEKIEKNDKGIMEKESTCIEDKDTKYDIKKDKKINNLSDHNENNTGDGDNNEEEEEEGDGDQHDIKWVIDTSCEFKKDQIRLKIPDDPNKWNVFQVQHWLKWAVREFNLTNIKLSDWQITGEQLCNMSQKEFEKKVPTDPDGNFRTHFELLRKCKCIAVLQINDQIKGKSNSKKSYKSISSDDSRNDSNGGINSDNHFDNNDENNKNTKETYYTDDVEYEPQIIRKVPKRSTVDKTFFGDHVKPPLSSTSKTDNSSSDCDNYPRSSGGQIQLWQFLLDLLTDYHYASIIHWISDDGEFRLADPEKVAKLWGIRKNKPNMNYEKLSRALRYYYDGDMISKVHGKRFVYKFVCDLKQLLGYDARDLARLVNECISKANKKETHSEDAEMN